MIIKTSDITSIQPFIDKLNFPKPSSHKGQNGKLLIIGGSSLFHAASLWSAAIASRLVDMVHYASTEENQQIFINLKTKFVDGIVVPRKDLLRYVAEDDCILVGPGMMRGSLNQKSTKSVKSNGPKFDQILKIENEADFSYFLTKFLIVHFPHKKFVFDAGAIQMMQKDWLLSLQEKPILTPHQGEFDKLFGQSVAKLTRAQKHLVVKETAKRYRCVIVLKAIDDIVSDGSSVVEVQGGNAGLTKGGTGDVLAGLITGLAAVNNQLEAAVVGSFLLKKAAETLFANAQFWYNTTDLVTQIPKTAKSVFGF